MSATNLRFEVADRDYDCNASLFLKDCLNDIWEQLSLEQKKAVESAKNNNWEVKKGEQCRRYTWDEGKDEEIDCVEIPAIAEIVTEFDLWP